MPETLYRTILTIFQFEVKNWFCSFLAVDEMRRGSTPLQAAEIAVKRIAAHYPSFAGGVIAVDKAGNYGAACHGMKEFPFSVADGSTEKVRVETVPCKVVKDKLDTNEVWKNLIIAIKIIIIFGNKYIQAVMRISISFI